MYDHVTLPSKPSHRSVALRGAPSETMLFRRTICRSSGTVASDTMTLAHSTKLMHYITTKNGRREFKTPRSFCGSERVTRGWHAIAGQTQQEPIAQTQPSCSAYDLCLISGKYKLWEHHTKPCSASVICGITKEGIVTERRLQATRKSPTKTKNEGWSERMMNKKKTHHECRLKLTRPSCSAYGICPAEGEYTIHSRVAPLRSAES